MKNIHVLPTDKPSRLFKIANVFVFDVYGIKYTERYKQLHNYINHNIYITSDEEIKEGDYAYHNILGAGKIVNVIGEECFVTIKQTPKDGSITTPWKRNVPNIKKIILTTDQDLIDDGVQGIDDEFLEWFVNNSSCEWVEVEEYYSFEIGDWVFKIIIPQEKPKMTECYFTPKKDTSSVTICNNCGQEKFLHTIGEGVKVSTYIINPKEEPKQETLEEVAERLFPINTGDESLDYQNEVRKPNWISGAKWQQERMYSDEEARIIWRAGQEYCKTSGDSITFEELTEKFKKK